jgi:hypothetical protein
MTENNSSFIAAALVNRFVNRVAPSAAGGKSPVSVGHGDILSQPATLVQHSMLARPDITAVRGFRLRQPVNAAPSVSSQSSRNSIFRTAIFSHEGVRRPQREMIEKEFFVAFLPSVVD